MAAGAVRASWIYEYMGTPSLGTGAPQTNHIDDLAAIGINTVLVKMLISEPTPLQLRYWKELSARAAAHNMTAWPIYNYQNSALLNRYRSPDRGYFPTATTTASTIGPVVACPNDPVYLRALLTGACTRMPETDRMALDGEFPTSPGGFHAYVNPCHCLPCRLEWWRSVNCPGGHCTIDPTTIVLPDDATLLAFQQTLHTSRVATFAHQARYTYASITDNQAGDGFTQARAAGLVAAGKQVTVWSELTYASGGPATQNYAGATVIGGLWLEKWSSATLTTQINNMGATGYFIFSSYSFWLGQTAVNTQPPPYDLPLDTIAAYQAALTAVNT